MYHFKHLILLLLIYHLRCGGVLLEGLIFDDKPKIEKQPDVLLSRKFVPHLLQDHLDVSNRWLMVKNYCQTEIILVIIKLIFHS